MHNFLHHLKNPREPPPADPEIEDANRHDVSETVWQYNEENSEDDKAKLDDWLFDTKYGKGDWEGHRKHFENAKEEAEHDEDEEPEEPEEEDSEGEGEKDTNGFRHILTRFPRFIRKTVLIWEAWKPRSIKAPKFTREEHIFRKKHWSWFQIRKGKQS